MSSRSSIVVHLLLACGFLSIGCQNDLRDIRQSELQVERQEAPIDSSQFILAESSVGEEETEDGPSYSGFSESSPKLEDVTGKGENVRQRENPTMEAYLSNYQSSSTIGVDNGRGSGQSANTQKITDNDRVADIKDSSNVVADNTMKPATLVQNLEFPGDNKYLTLVFDSGAIHEYISFEVPDEKVLSRLVLTEYDGEDDVAFYGIKSGCCQIWSASPEIVPQLEVWSHIGPEDVMSNILSYSGDIRNTNSSPTAISESDREYRVLGPGFYVLLVQNANIGGAKYEFLFNLE